MSRANLQLPGACCKPVASQAQSARCPRTDWKSAPREVSGAMVLLALVAQNPSKKAVADAMMVFSVGAILGLTSGFIAYLNRTIRLEWPKFTTWRRPLRWLAVAAAILGVACFFVGMNVARNSIEDASSSTIRSTTRAKSKSPLPPQEQPIAPQPAEPQTTEPPAPQTEPQPEPPTTEPRPGEPQQREI